VTEGSAAERTSRLSGLPVPGDYKDPRTPEQRDAERRMVSVQVRSLGGSRTDGYYQRRLIEEVQRRRASQADKGVLQFDVVQSKGIPTLIVSGELLVRREFLAADGFARDVLSRAGFAEKGDSAGDCPELSKVVARFTRSDIEAEELAGVGRWLRGRRIPASVNHVTPLAAIIKGLGGAEPSSGRRPFATATRPAEPDGRVPVAVIDTGIAAEKRGDQWLQYADVPRPGDNFDETNVFPDGNDPFLDFGSGHGTFVTGIVQQVHPTAKICVYRAVDSDGIGSEMRVGCAMIRAVEEGARILNLSVGSQTIDDGPPVALEAALEIIGQRAPDALVIAAAGNYGDTRPCWPAAFRRVVAVGAVKADLTPAADWSSHGVWVDCSTVGEGVVSTYLPGQESPFIDPSPDLFGEDSWAVWTGTSFAAPQIAGAIARLCDSDGLTPRQALAALLAAGFTLPNFGRVVEILPGT
jgi:hypothetical protein